LLSLSETDKNKGKTHPGDSNTAILANGGYSSSHDMYRYSYRHWCVVSVPERERERDAFSVVTAARIGFYAAVKLCREAAAIPLL